MQDVCNSIAITYDIKFNAKKSIGIKFVEKVVDTELLYFSGNLIR